MKGFKHTGNGPKYGSFSFPAKAGFGPSSGKVKSIAGYSRRSPKRKAIGGLVEDNIVEAPGFSDYAKGGKVGKLKRLGAFRQKIELNQKSENRMLDAISANQRSEAQHERKFGAKIPVKKARGGKIEGVSDPMTASEAMKHSRGGRAFNRTPKIGK